ncbi:MAG: hypothetical protein HYS32_04265 [Candidatus Woesearchaeota archaeon]|nr:MAG: hypothetical protein HYS32_04265 [Candidatus Woesearchaeota archaeon]
MRVRDYFNVLKHFVSRNGHNDQIKQTLPTLRYVGRKKTGTGERINVYALEGSFTGYPSALNPNRRQK